MTGQDWHWIARFPYELRPTGQASRAMTFSFIVIRFIWIIFGMFVIIRFSRIIQGEGDVPGLPD
ncbi:MAG: hypothetical protein WBB37_04700 [bacterium]